MSEEKKFALLIDSDNVSAKYAPFILKEAEKYGSLTYKRVYGDWEKGGAGWHTVAVNNAILPVQQTCYITGKNVTDFSMIIDAMDILYTGTVDGFILVTSDSDFTRLAIRLRESGKLVVGIGEVKTPKAFTSSCHYFSYLNQSEPIVPVAPAVSVAPAVHGAPAVLAAPASEPVATPVAPATSSLMPAPAPGTLTVEQIKTAIFDCFAENNKRVLTVSTIQIYLENRFGKIDFQKVTGQTGTLYKRFSKFIDKLPEFRRNGSDITNLVRADADKKAVYDKFVAIVKREVTANPEGFNLGQLNTILCKELGRDYLKKSGYKDYLVAIGTVEGIKTDNTNIYPETAQISVPADELPIEESDFTKSDITAFITDYLAENGKITFVKLGNILVNQFGREYLKTLDAPTLKAYLKGEEQFEVKHQSVTLNTEMMLADIAKLTNDFVRSEGSHSLRSLSFHIKKSYPAFDFTNYGYAKFGEFVNSIEGVKSNGYYAEPDFQAEPNSWAEPDAQDAPDDEE